MQNNNHSLTLMIIFNGCYVTIKDKISHKTAADLGKITIVIINNHTWLNSSLWVAQKIIIGRMSSSSAQHERMEFTQCFKIAENKRWLFYHLKTDRDRVISTGTCIVKSENDNIYVKMKTKVILCK